MLKNFLGGYIGNGRNLNKLCLGAIGPASKRIVIREEDFKKEYAPPNAKIEHIEIDGENYVRMTYRV